MARSRAKSLLIVFSFFAFVLFITHFRLLELPYFWDEAGQFIPQTHDLWKHGLLVPQSTSPNSHPPGLPILLAGFWTLFGDSIEGTRAFLLLIAAAFFTISFLLSVELLKGSHGAPAFLAGAMMLCNPLLYTQSMMAQLDLPTAVFSTLLLLAYVQKRERLAVVAALLSVAFKETSIGIPLTLAFFAWREGRTRFALALAGLPALLLANWFGFMAFKTGYLFGDPAYAKYNLSYPLHPVRLAYALFRRFSYLAIENWHLIPAMVLLFRWRQIGFAPVWRPIVAAVTVHTLVVSVSGGAVLERYLLPVLPVLYTAFAAGLSTLRPKPRYLALGFTCLGLFSMIFLNPPWPYALENNLAMVDLVEIERNASGFAEVRFRDHRITTAWPMTDALRKPYLGYVEKPIPNVRSVEDFSLDRLKALDWKRGDVLILYSRSWDPDFGLTQWPALRAALRRYFGTPLEMTPRDIPDLPQLKPYLGYSQRGLWVEILVVP
ncbi:ArnT family glycosyltransferase [Bryobacter aggregatus]|uniref:ArnT family glycosyltransferase n=1 Tax=Bryobacter aggregatus TaxID=360054 RepID=UPI0004E0BAA2|nr:hypothetical protein [Bryobacter aggregatus]